MPSPTDRLLSQLNQTQLAQKDNPVYQVIKQLINQIKELENLVDGGGGGGGGGGSTLITNNFVSQFINPLSYLENDSDIYYMSVGGSSGSTPVTDDHYDSPLSDGDLTNAELIFADGECIIVQVPI